MKTLITALLILNLISCTGYQIKNSISKYENQSSKIEIGDTKQEVLEILEPTQTLKKKYRKKPEKYISKDGSLIEIYYYRSGWVSDGLTTDDEFIPYVFKDGVLIGIGWTSIGGVKTQGQARDIIIINN